MTAGRATSQDSARCPICGQEISRGSSAGAKTPLFPCPRCGTYRLDERAMQRLYEASGSFSAGSLQLLAHHHLLSAVLRERFEQGQREEVYVSSLEELQAAARPLAGGPLEAVDRLLLYTAERAPRVGAPARIIPDYDYPVAYARDGMELRHIASLAEEMGYLRQAGGAADSVELTIRPEGWKHLQQLRSTRVERRQAFVAMWFAEEMTPVYLEGFEPALRDAGYRPLRIDRVEHNEKIDDRIIAAIRQSGLLVADFTKHRGGVYFEAGLAMGLGLPVIWTCRSDFIAEAHFDTRQYNHVVWNTPAELREKLRARIEATLPTFPAEASPAPRRNSDVRDR